MGHEVIVANPRRLSMISGSKRKNDRLDAAKLARLGRVDPKLLAPIQHRDEDVQRDLMEIRMRHVLVESRTKLVNSARGQVKSMAYRLRRCDCDQVGVELAADLPEEMRQPVEVLLETVAHLTKGSRTARARRGLVREDQHGLAEPGAAEEVTSFHVRCLNGSSPRRSTAGRLLNRPCRQAP
jgi:transposase